MYEIFVINTLIGYFKTEISNTFKLALDALIIELSNGEKAKIKVTCLS